MLIKKWPNTHDQPYIIDFKNSRAIRVEVNLAVCFKRSASISEG